MKRFLVIDDDKLVRESINLILTDAGYQADLAKSAKQGIELYKKNKYDIVITDIIMPEKDGFETIQDLIQLDKYIKIIAISGGARNGAGAYLPIATNMGAKAILYKPFDDEELLKTIKAID